MLITPVLINIPTLQSAPSRPSMGLHAFADPTQDPARKKNRTDKKCPVLTTADGALIGEQQAMTAGPRGPVLMQDVQLLEQMQHFNRERIPERVLHAKGSAAYGTFTVTSDITEYSKAK